jgi:hypothetical protein
MFLQPNVPLTDSLLLASRGVIFRLALVSLIILRYIREGRVWLVCLESYQRHQQYKNSQLFLDYYFYSLIIALCYLSFVSLSFGLGFSLSVSKANNTEFSIF